MSALYVLTNVRECIAKEVTNSTFVISLSSMSTMQRGFLSLRQLKLSI